MKIRTQLVAALSLLAVVPLTVIVLYSYISSLRAVRAAEEAQAASKVGRIEEQLGVVQEELSRRIRTLDGMKMANLFEDGVGDGAQLAMPLAERVLLHLGDAAPVVSRLEYLPMAPTPPTAPEAESQIAVEVRVSGPADREPSRVVSAATDAPIVVDVAKALNDLEGVLDRVQVISQVDRYIELEEIAEPSDLDGENEGAFDFQLGEAMGDTFDDSWVFSSEGFVVPVMEGGARVGGLRIGIGEDELARTVLSKPLSLREDDLTFALDETGELFHAEGTIPEDVVAQARAAVEKGGGTHFVADEYVVVTTVPDPSTGLSFVVARPLEPVLAGVRGAAVRNLVSGLGLILLAAIGVLPLASRMTRNLDSVIAGVERVAQGDLNVRVPVRSRNEFGRLAEAVNSMAVELLDQEVRLVEQARQSQEQEVRERLLQSEYERKSQELEEARRFQLSLLPKELPDHTDFEVAVAMQTAAEVGGDYYDFRLDPAGELTVAIGDATGHGARAGTMVTVIKSLFSASTRNRPSGFLEAAGAAIRRMDLGRMLMALTVARVRRDQLVFSAAGMPPILLHRRATAALEELSMAGMPLGGMSWEYEERRVPLNSGDTLLFLSDGFPEATDPSGEPFGYERVASAFASAAAGSADEVLQRLLTASAEWRGEGVLGDDLTLVVLRVA